MNDIQREHNLEQVRNLRQIISGKRSLARAIFDGLLPGQKRLLMDASGINARTAMIYNSDSRFNYTHLPDFDHLTDTELDDLTKGLRRLQAIIDAFAHCNQQDLFPEMPVTVKGFKKEIDSSEWIITRCTHSITATGGFVTSLELEIKLE